jgi:hypothetical protein
MHGGYSSTANCRTKTLTIFGGIFAIFFFAVFHNFYLFVARFFLSKPLFSAEPWLGTTGADCNK